MSFSTKLIGELKCVIQCEFSWGNKMFQLPRNEFGEMKCVIQCGLSWVNEICHAASNLLGKSNVSFSPKLIGEMGNVSFSEKLIVENGNVSGSAKLKGDMKYIIQCQFNWELVCVFQCEYNWRNEMCYSTRN